MKTIIASLVEDQTEILLRLTAIEGYMDLPAGTLTRTPTGKTLRWTVAKNLDVLDPWLADHRDKLIVRRIYKDPDRTATSIAEDFGVSVTIVARAIREGTALLRRSFSSGEAPEALYEAAEVLKGGAA